MAAILVLGIGRQGAAQRLKSVEVESGALV
jgi:hypothetical protein